MVLSRRLHAVHSQIIVAGCQVAHLLGVTISSNLSWSAHIDNTCAKAMKQLGLLYQHFHTAGWKALSRLYKSTVLSAPAGLLCLCVGPPTTCINILKVIQKFAA